MSPTLLQAVVRVADSRTPDAELLERFRRNRDERAFEELVRRHGPLVWAVCRQLLPHHADAEDAFQAVFLALVRGAGSIRSGQALPAWLHGVAARVAVKARRSAVRRRQREQRAAVPERSRPVPDESWTALMGAVHEEIGKLPEAERTAFVLCDLEGVRQPDAAARLGWPLGTLSGRLCKARQRLVDQLTRRGVAPVVLALGGLAGSAGTVPASLLELVNSFPTAPAAGIPSTVASLARGLVEGTTMRMKMLAAAVLVAGAFSMSGGALVLSQAGAQGGGGATAGAPVSGQNRSPKNVQGKGNNPVGSGAAVGEPGETDDGPAFVAPQGKGGMVKMGPAAAAAGWEYRFVDIEGDRREFERVITQNGRDGWEFCESQRTNDKGRDSLVLVFKRPRGGRTIFGGGAMAPMPGMPGGMGGFGGGMVAPGFGMRPGGLGGQSGFGSTDLPGAGGMVNRLTAGDIEARTQRLKSTNATDLAKEIEKALPNARTLKVVPEATSNMIIIVADSATMREVNKIIETHEKSAPEGRGTGVGVPAVGSGAGVPARPGGATSGREARDPGGARRSPGGASLGTGPAPRAAGELKVFVLKHAKAQELLPVVERLFRTAEFTAEARTNQLIIRADARTLEEVSALLERLDVELPRR